VQPGDTLLSVNGRRILDVLDYKYYTYDRDLLLEFRTAAGRVRRVRVRKPEGADLGLDFETYLMDRPRACANDCVFCFIDQNPPGMRQSIYFKDDDARLSFLMGCYITLTNLSAREVQRIIDLHISPVNVSVHTTDPALREKLLRSPRAGESLGILRRFAEAGITMNCQIVCCPGWNDGAASLPHAGRPAGALSRREQRQRRARRAHGPSGGARRARPLHAGDRGGDDRPRDGIRKQLPGRIGHEAGVLRRRALPQGGHRIAAGRVLRGAHPA
jgi:hypothetical protein